jgi:hypothetical protein
MVREENDKRGNDKSGEIIPQAKLGGNKIPWNNPGVKYHGKEKEKAKTVHVFIVTCGKTIGREIGDYYRQGCARYGNNNRNTVTPHYLGAGGENYTVGLE